MSALLGASIPIPQALSGLGQEEENPALRQLLLKLADSVRRGASFSAALDEHPRCFSKLYVSMVRVGEEAGALPKVMADLAELLEHEDEVRGEVMAAVAYPVFVLCFGVVTVTVLLTVVMPRLFSMLQEMLQVLPLPTLILLKVSGVLHQNWPWLALGLGGAIGGLRWYLQFALGRHAVGRCQAPPAVGWPGLPRGRPQPFCPDLGHPGPERRFPAAGPQNRREHHRQPGPGSADRPGRRRNPRGRFPGHAVAQAGPFPQNRRPNG